MPRCFMFIVVMLFTFIGGAARQRQDAADVQGSVTRYVVKSVDESEQQR